MAFLGSTIQQMAANKISSPYYRFDGVDDYVDISASHNSTEGSFSIWFLHTTDTGTGTYQFIFTDSSSNFELAYTPANSGTLTFYVANSGLSWTDYSRDYKWHHVVGTFSISGNSKKIYFDGVQVASTTISTGTSGQNQYVGSRAGSYPWRGQVSSLKYYNNALSATEIKELYSGTSVPYKYKGANQTDVVSGWDFTGWAASNATVVNATSFTTAANVTGGTRKDYGIKGKRYRMRIAGTTASSACKVIAVDSLTNLSGNMTGTFDETFEFTQTDTGFRIQGINNTGSATLTTITTLTLVQIGAIAEYDGGGATSTKWYDKSGNNLDGTVSGASLENKITALHVSDNSVFDGQVKGANLFASGDQVNWGADGGTAGRFRIQAGGKTAELAVMDSNTMTFLTNNTLALTLGTDQSATFAGNIDVTKASNAVMTLTATASGTGARLKLKSANNDGTYIAFDDNDDTTLASIYSYGSAYGTTALRKNLVFKTGGGTTALTLDASQNATFAGTMAVTGNTTFSNYVHIERGNTGATANSGADELVVENTGAAGISILAADNADATMYFGTASDPTGGYLQWDYDNGSVGKFVIGTQKAGAVLDFRAGAGSSFLTVAADGATSFTDNATFAGWVYATDGVYIMALNGDNQIRVGQTGNGSTALAIGNRTITVYDASDERKKDIIGETERGLSDVLKWSIKDFTWKPEWDRDSTTINTGAIAQEFIKVNPELVNKHEIEDENGNMQDGVWGIEYIKTIPYLIKAVQELSEKNEALEKRIEELKK